MKLNIKKYAQGHRWMSPSISRQQQAQQQPTSSLLMRRNNHISTVREISLRPSVIIIHVVMTALCIALTTFLWRSAQKILKGMIGTLETWAIIAESTNWQDKFEEFSNRFVARMRQIFPTLPPSSSSPTETDTADSGVFPSDHTPAEHMVESTTIHNDIRFEMDKLIPTNVPLVPVSFVSSSSVSTVEAIQSEATVDLNLSTARPMYYPMPMPTYPTTFFIPSGENDITTEAIKGIDNIVEGSKENSPSNYSVILQMEELQRQVSREMIHTTT